MLRCKIVAGMHESFLTSAVISYKHEASIPLARFIEVSLYLNTTNVHDRLYGGYGILDRFVMQNIPVDYGISLNTLSQQLSALLLTEGKLTFVLQHCTGLKDPVPTWCINLDGPTSRLGSIK